MTKEHHHQHDHRDEPNVIEDPAAKSLSDALTVSFTLLKIIMAALVIIYLLSGFFSVTTQERAVRLTFGKIVGDEGEQVYDANWYFGWPVPIGQVIKVPINTRTININTAFWHEISDGDAGQVEAELATNAKPLNPEKDGSLLTGDANIVHGRFTVNYVIAEENVVDFVSHVGLATLGAELHDGTIVRDEMLYADRIVRSAAEQAIVFAVAQTEADVVIAGDLNVYLAQQRAQEVLDTMHSGITIDKFLRADQAMPLPVRRAYDAVSNAESERAQQMEKAHQQRARILGETAGEAHEALFQLVQKYEHAHSAKNQDLIDQLGAELDDAFTNLKITGPQGTIPIGGKVAQTISQARTYRTQVVEQIKTEAATFTSLLDQYQDNPRIVTNRLWQDAREEIFSGDIETWYVMDGKIYITTNRDPQLARDRETKTLIQEQEDARKAAGN